MRFLFTFGLLLLSITFGFADDHSEQELIPSTAEEIGAQSQSFLIKDLISPLSGQPSLRKTDLVVRCAQDIRLERIYMPPHIQYPLHKEEKHQNRWDQYCLFNSIMKNYKGWRVFPHQYVQVYPQKKIVRVSDPNGLTVEFHSTKKTSQLISDTYGMTNTSGEIPSGIYDPRNTKVYLDHKRYQVTVNAPDGTKRIYRCHLDLGKEYAFYKLEKEILPNGKVLKYSYDKARRLSKIESLSPDASVIYASIELHGEPENGKCTYTSSAQDKVTYYFEKRSIDVQVKKDVGAKGTFPPILTSVSSPFFREETLNYSDHFSLELYEGKNEFFKCNEKLFGSATSKNFRVDKLLFPTNSQDDFEEACSIIYHPPVLKTSKGTTIVRHADGTKTFYRFTDDFLTEAIETYDKHGILHLQKCYSWTDRGWLSEVSIQDGQGRRYSKKTYQYDTFGNPIRESLEGDLTGSGEIESYTIKRAYSQDEQNLLLREEQEDGKILHFEYLKGTNLVTSKLTSDKDQILLREFFLYDEHNNLIEKIVDDGSSLSSNDLSGITERTITTYTLKKDAPFIEMPEWIEEKYLENGEEKLAQRTHLHYDRWGNISQEDVYDNQKEFAYSIYKTYNERGDLLTETNPLGQKRSFTYDKKGRCIQSTNYSQKLQNFQDFDSRGRKIHSTQKGTDGIIKPKSYLYDENDHIIQKIDEYKNETRYSYDPISHQVATTEFTPLGSLDEELIPVITHSNYDPLGREISRTDANGNTVHYTYNARGDKTSILYPDGALETFTYYKNGKLKQHTNADGLTTEYAYDILGRIISKKYSVKELIAEESFRYSAFHLLSETDKEGNITAYTYDGFGRKIEENRSGRITEYRYDSLGRIKTDCQYNGENTLLTHYKRDLLDRIISQKKTDVYGNLLYKISYSYDEDGNQTELIHYFNNKPETTSFTYDSFGRLTCQTDPCGHSTQIFYNDRFLNAFGQGVLQKTSINAKGIKTVYTYNTLGKITAIETLNSKNKKISRKAFWHDPCSNLLQEEDHIYDGTHYLDTQKVCHEYNNCNLTKSTTRAWDTPNQRKTHYTYTLSGKLKTKTLPNSTVLTYSYDPLGFLKSLSSSDETIDHTFETNLLGDLQSATDNINQIHIQRETDPFGNILKETFSTGLAIEKTYDAFDRPLTLIISNQSGIHYQYDPLFLRSVTRTSPDGAPLYTHKYEQYDLDGNLTLEKSILDCGTITHRIDNKGRQKALKSPYLNQLFTYDPCDNPISIEEDTRKYTFAYDELDQLIQENEHEYRYDSNYNRLAANKELASLNELNELQALGSTKLAYDLNGNLITKTTPTETVHYTYDALNQLIEASTENQTIHFTYDPLGRRLIKQIQDGIRECYLWDRREEIGSANTLKVMGAKAPIAIEIKGRAYAPIQDIQGNIRHLVNAYTKKNTISHTYSAFGEEINPQVGFHQNPWRYAGKRWDQELSLSYFGKRYYDPRLGRWLTTDPAGAVDATNLYQYVFNNPFLYRDPDGEFIFVIPIVVWGAGVALPSLTAIGTAVAAGVAAGAVAYGGYKLVDSLNNQYNQSQAWDQYESQQSIYRTETEEKKKSTNPFDGPINDDVVVIDPQGNAINIPQGNWLTGTKDGKWIQERTPDGTTKGRETGTRKDGGHKPSPSHTDPRSLKPHAHVPGITNPDGTPWLPIYE